jgi:hypothetical protein
MLNTTVASPDVLVHDHGTIFLLDPQTEEGKVWMRENCQAESWQWQGPCLAIEPRSAGAIVEGMLEDGLVVQ